MAAHMCVKINPKDNVAIALKKLDPGTIIDNGVVVQETIPQAHKVTLTDICRGEEVIRYGVSLGLIKKDTPAGSWVNETSLELPEAPSLDAMEWGTNIVTDLPKPKRTSWEGYVSSDGTYAGTRNYLGIQTTVQCVTGVVNQAIERIRTELLPKYPHVDGVVAINHAYGCGVAINARDAYIPKRILRNIARHPNFGGELMLISLGCEKFSPDKFLEDRPEDNTPENVIVLQECHGFDDMMKQIMDMADRKLKKLELRRRITLPLSDLLVGMECGGSDAFSGVASNPAIGYCADLLVSGGGTVMFSEVTEVRDGVHFLAKRCVSKEVEQRLADEMHWYDEYLKLGGADRSANPTPGNKKGGLSNIVEKAMGSIAKSGTSPIVEVLSPGERPTKHGLIYAATPASDIVSGPCQLASGMGAQCFTTGRGTPYGLAMVPVLKVCSRNEVRNQWPDLIDVNAGPISAGERTVAEVGEELFDLLLDTVSGKRLSYAEQHGLANDLCIFNPAPIT
jgi:galactarate dehydratase